MNDTTVIGNATKDGEMSPNGRFYEVTVADSPPPTPEGKEARYVTKFIRCSLFVEEGETPPTIKKGQRCLAVGQELRRDWEDEAKGTKGTELEMRCWVLRPMGGKLNDYVAQDDAEAGKGAALKGGKKAPAKAGKVKKGDSDIPF